MKRRRHGQHAPLDERHRGMVHVAAHKIRIADAVDQGRGLRILRRSAQRDAQPQLPRVSYGAEGVGAQTNARRGAVRLAPGAHGAGQIDVKPPQSFLVFRRNERKHFCQGFLVFQRRSWVDSLFVYIPLHPASSTRLTIFYSQSPLH